MYQNKNLQKKANEVLIEADKHRWAHQSSWMGEPILNLQQDILAIENIFWNILENVEGVGDISKDFYTNFGQNFPHIPQNNPIIPRIIPPIITPKIPLRLSNIYICNKSY